MLIEQLSKKGTPLSGLCFSPIRGLRESRQCSALGSLTFALSCGVRVPRRRSFRSLRGFNGTFFRFATNVRHRRLFPTPRNAVKTLVSTSLGLYSAAGCSTDGQRWCIFHESPCHLTVVSNFVIAIATHPVLLDDGGGGDGRRGRGGE